MPKPLPKSAIRVIRSPKRGDAGIVCLRLGKKIWYYAVREIPCDIGGRGFAVHRLGLGELYHVRVGRPTECSCECLGFLRHGHCKHLRALQALMEHGVL